MQLIKSDLNKFTILILNGLISIDHLRLEKDKKLTILYPLLS